MDAKDLFTYYVDFAYDNASDRLDSLQLSSDQSGKSECAIMTRRLLNLSKDLDTEGRIKESIEKYGEHLEKELLKSFDKAYRRGDLKEMRQYAKVLHDFNGGTSVVKIFVNQHDFFIVREKLENQQPSLGSGDLYRFPRYNVLMVGWTSYLIRILIRRALKLVLLIYAMKSVQ
jgi:exocyst complex component 5